MKHVFIFDPVAFAENQLSIKVSKGRPRFSQQEKPEDVLDRIGMYFRTQEKPDWSTQQSRFPRDALGIIQKEIDDAKTDDTIRIYAVGGDEILFDCLNGIAGVPNMELAAVPYGRTNEFLRAFGEGKAPQFRNFQTLIPAPAIPTDIISTGNNYAINSCAVGFTPTTVIKTKELKRNRGRIINSFIFSGILNLLSNLTAAFSKGIVACHYDITIDDKDYGGNYSQINISNCPAYGGNRTGVKGAMPNDGVLDVALFKSVGPLRTLMSLGASSKKKTPSNCLVFQAKKITIKTEKPVWIRLDTEYYQESSITFEVMPGAVQIAAVDNLSYQKR